MWQPPGIILYHYNSDLCICIKVLFFLFFVSLQGIPFTIMMSCVYCINSQLYVIIHTEIVIIVSTFLHYTVINKCISCIQVHEHFWNTKKEEFLT